MITFYIVSIIVVLLYFLVEYTILHHVINSIPIRILVNGTKGKSTTVKIIFDILKGNGQKVFAKITGDNPILIDSNGDETIVKRFAPASIVENIRIL
ncbi:MAG: poly-gamma-glutamate synthase PgsB, partial [Arcobacter sp.]|nr:poly-gamma-glutamate synthase PgsB [Arcobacter sp.]